MLSAVTSRRHARSVEEHRFDLCRVAPDSMTQVLSQARKITCAGVRPVRGLSVVFSVMLVCRPFSNCAKRNDF